MILSKCFSKTVPRTSTKILFASICQLSLMNHIGADIDEMNVQPHMEPEIHLQNVWLCDMKGKTSFAHINYL